MRSENIIVIHIVCVGMASGGMVRRKIEWVETFLRGNNFRYFENIEFLEVGNGNDSFCNFSYRVALRPRKVGHIQKPLHSQRLRVRPLFQLRPQAFFFGRCNNNFLVRHFYMVSEKLYVAQPRPFWNTKSAGEKSQNKNNPN